MKYKALYILLIFFSLLPIKTQALWVDIEGIRNKEGIIQLAVFENQEQFSDEKPSYVYEVNKLLIEKGKISVAVNLNIGTYGITILDDEDHSGYITYKFLVYPVEGVGFSDFYLDKLKKPKFSDFSFQLTEKNQRVTVKMKYFN